MKRQQLRTIARVAIVIAVAVLTGPLATGPAQAAASPSKGAGVTMHWTALPNSGTGPAPTAVTASYGPVWINFFHSGLCLDNPGPTLANVWLDQYGCVPGATNEWWYFDFVGSDGWARIRNAYSNKCLNVEYASTANGARVIQYPCGNYANELWKGPQILFRAVDQYGVVRDFYRLHAFHSGKCLNVSGASTAYNAKMIQWDCGNYANEYVTWFAPRW